MIENQNKNQQLHENQQLQENTGTRSHKELSKSDELLQEYNNHHHTAGNQLAHYLGIPLLLMGLFGLLSWMPLPHYFIRWNAARLFLVLGILFYFLLDWRRAAPFSIVIFGMYTVGVNLPWYIQIVCLVGGLILQVIGHVVFEKESKNFITDITHFLIGPLWIFSKFLAFAKRETPLK